MRHLLTASILAVGMAIAAPAFAQEGGGATSNNDSNTVTDGVVGSEGVINDSFQDSSTNTTTKTYSSADQDNDSYTKTYNSADQDNDTYTKTVTKTDTETVTVTKDNNNQDNDVKDSYNQDNDTKTYTYTSSDQDNDTKDSYNQDNDTWTYSGNTEIVADQEMKAVIYNGGDLNFEASFHAGSNSVSDNAFAAYAGILNQSWNTGGNANVQAATNIAAQGSITFTSGSSSNSQANPVTTTLTVTPPPGGGE